MHANRLKECVLARSLREGTYQLLDYIEHLDLLLKANAVERMSTDEAIAQYPKNGTMKDAASFINRMSLFRISEVLNTHGIATSERERVAVVLNMGKYVHILQLPTVVPDANRRILKSELKQRLQEYHNSKK